MSIPLSAALASTRPAIPVAQLLATDSHRALLRSNSTLLSHSTILAALDQLAGICELQCGRG